MTYVCLSNECSFWNVMEYQRIDNIIIYEDGQQAT